MINIKQLCKSFGNNRVLNNITFDMVEGQSLAIVGQSGTGKSVLLKNMIGLMKPDSGEVWIDDELISSLSFKQLQKVRTKIGMVFQSGALFDSLTVGDNIGLGLKKLTILNINEQKDRILESLSEVNLEGTENLMPAELSGGMRKRVGIARAIAIRPKYLFYDEPTTGLDPIMTDIINKLIVKFQKEYNMTSLIITHETKTIFDVAEKVIMLDDGKIIYNGETNKIKENETPLIKRFFTGNSEMNVGSKL
ncbi:MAG: ATP-binding cassette domain-containing protein [Candidatus Marinimicrobia bacterium]|nr:ATP-binding cassette domain-containing protein [Candidatus Neomarinimicrobiota bacterium]